MRFVPTAVAVATALLAMVPFARAADAGQDSLSPQQRLHQARAHMHQRALQAKGGTYKIDIEGPQLTGFEAGTLVNLNRLDQNTLRVNLAIHDNLVGLSRVDVIAQPLSGSGNGAYGSTYTSFPAKRTDADVIVDFYGAAETGQWQVTSVNLYDANDNVTTYDAAALAALGNNQFTLTNRNSTDRAAPTLKSGRILTPVVSLSKAPRGEYPQHAARVGLELSASDEGSPRASGLGNAYVTLCQVDGWDCLYLNGSTLTPGAKSGKFILGTDVYPYYPGVGEYRVQSVQLNDAKGNTVYLDAGTTDFDVLFGGSATVILTE